jgi:hypothetical protein
VNIFNLNHYGLSISGRACVLKTLSICAILAVTACGQGPVDLAQSELTAPSSVAKTDLLYVSNGSREVTVYNYKTRKLVQIIRGFQDPKGECADGRGDIFIVDAKLKQIFEYQHGQRKPIKTLTNPKYVPYGCSVSPATGDLAVANNAKVGGGNGGIAIYRGATGRPKIYPNVLSSPIGCAYDNLGDLFVVSYFTYGTGHAWATFAYLPKGARSFIRIVQLPGIKDYSQPQNVNGVRWDGEYWAVLYSGNIYEYSIDNNGTATLANKTVLYKNGLVWNPGEFWIANGEVVTVETYQDTTLTEDAINYWNYPSGGSLLDSINSYLNDPYGVAVSETSNR